MTVTCKNCNQKVDGNFCSSCGQSAHTHDINFHYVVHEIQHGIAHVDKGFFFTIKELFSRPGDTIREYIEGKRVKHFKPLAFLLIVSTIYAFVSHTLDSNPVIESALKGYNDAGKQAGNSYLFIDWLIGHYAYTSLLLIPISSASSYLVFRKARYNYFQHLVLNAFADGQKTVFYIACVFITYLINKNKPSYTLGSIQLVVGLMLTFWLYFQFFGTIKPTHRALLILINYALSLLFFFLVAGLSTFFYQKFL
jgi:hypothetical protein